VCGSQPVVPALNIADIADIAEQGVSRGHLGWTAPGRRPPQLVLGSGPGSGPWRRMRRLVTLGTFCPDRPRRPGGCFGPGPGSRPGTATTGPARAGGRTKGVQMSGGTGVKGRRGSGAAGSRRARAARSRRGGPGRLVGLVGVALLGWAVAKELRKPPAERTWTGQLAGTVPYDLRWPTPARLRERLWAPEDPRIIMPRAFGVGWTLNVGRLVRLVRERRAPSGPPQGDDEPKPAVG